MATDLQSLAPGATARVTGYAPGGAAYRQKLLAMGLTPGTTIRVLRVAPLGDPVVIEVRGSQLSLRKAEAAALTIQDQTA